MRLRGGRHLTEVSKLTGGIAGNWSWVGPPRLSWKLFPPFLGPRWKVLPVRWVS